MPQREFTYDKYLTAPPTPLMEHLEEWIKDKTGFDPSQVKTKADAFSMGLRLTVALRGHHQESEENQERLRVNRLAANERDAAAIARREARLQMGVKPMGRLPKSAVEPEPEPAPKPKRGRPKKITEPVSETVAEEEQQTTKPRRGRPRKATAPSEPEPSNVTPIRQPADKATASPRRRPVRRSGEKPF